MGYISLLAIVFQLTFFLSQIIPKPITIEHYHNARNKESHNILKHYLITIAST